MNKYQLRYAVAKAALEALHQEVDERMADTPEPGRGATEAEVRAYVEKQTQIEDDLGYFTIHAEWCEARKALIEWGKEITLRLAKPEQRAELEEMYSKLDYHPTIREKVIDLAFRLNA